MKEYPKIETLFIRDEKTKKIDPFKIRLPEFKAISKWDITEKIDGMNIRICLTETGEVKISGRTDNSQLRGDLFDFLNKQFFPEKLKSIFWKENETPFEVMIFGEGYGGKIQKGGNYRQDVSIRIFDILIGKWWLKKEDIENISNKLQIQTVPNLGTIEYLPRTRKELEDIIPYSKVSQQDSGYTNITAEGIVAKEPHGLLLRNGNRLMWKLKFKDF